MVDEIQGEGLQETGLGEATAVDTGSQVTETPTETEPAGSAEPAISIDENGELHIADEMLIETKRAEVEPLAEATKVREEPVAEQEKLPEVYSPEDMAKAFIENTVEMARLPAEMQGYYKAILAEQQRRSEILNINRPEQQQPVQPVQPVARPQPPAQKAPSPEQYAQLQDAGKILAARMLGIAESEFDEYNPNHQQAQHMAMNDIRVRAQQIEQERYQQQVQAYQQQQIAARQQGLAGAVAEFQKNPNWQDIDKNFYPGWREKLDQRTGQVVDGIMAEGNPSKVQALMNQIVKAYEAQKTPHKEVKAPPPVMSSTQSTDVVESKGMADASKLADMTPEERASWFMTNKFV